MIASKRTALYTFEWIGGGYNQVRATSKKEALTEVDKKFGQKWRVALSTLRRLSEAQEAAYWKEFNPGGKFWTD